MKRIDVMRAKSGWFEWFVEITKSRKSIRKQKTFCYCPTCKEDLCSNESFLSDTDLVRYKCSNCGTESDWDFGLFPMPFLVASQVISKEKIEL